MTGKRPDGRTLRETQAVPVMLTVAGKRFVCECRANVFSKVGGEYRCNGCERRYVGE